MIILPYVNISNLPPKVAWLSTIKSTQKKDNFQLMQIDKVEQMPNIPSPFQMRDWKQVAQDYDDFLFNFNKTGDYLPLISWDTRNWNFERDTFSLPSYVGTVISDEAINCISAVVSATLVGINKSDNNGNNWVLMC